MKSRVLRPTKKIKIWKTPSSLIPRPLKTCKTTLRGHPWTMSTCKGVVPRNSTWMYKALFGKWGRKGITEISKNTVYGWPIRQWISTGRWRGHFDLLTCLGLVPIKISSIERWPNGCSNPVIFQFEQLLQRVIGGLDNGVVIGRNMLGFLKF